MTNAAQAHTAVDVLVIGGGPAGLAAALELRRRGVARVLVVDREAQAGGVPRHTTHSGFGVRDLHTLLSGPQYAARYVRLAEAAGVAVRTGTTATDWIGPTAVSLTSAGGIEGVEARAIILATGCRERPRAARLVPGTRPVGVLTTGALQQMVALRQLPVGRRAVVAGAEHVSFSAVLTLAHAGVATVAMTTQHTRHQTLAPLHWLTAGLRRVPVLTETRLSAIHGTPRVEAVEVTELRSGARRMLACDTVVFTGDWIADHELARRGGLAMDPATRAPRVDLALRTSVRGVFAAGNLLHGAESADVAALGGRHAALAVHSFLTTGEWPATPPIALLCQAPLRWVSPSAAEYPRRLPPRGRFILRVGELRRPADLRVSQGNRELWRQPSGRLIPNRPIHCAAHWLSQIDAKGGPITFQLA